MAVTVAMIAMGTMIAIIAVMTIAVIIVVMIRSVTVAIRAMIVANGAVISADNKSATTAITMIIIAATVMTVATVTGVIEQDDFTLNRRPVLDTGLGFLSSLVARESLTPLSSQTKCNTYNRWCHAKLHTAFA